ncbi:hypothetical protein Q9314_20995 (plasmid) [Shinella sumterensis]|nr:hypothetical protein Q9314_20995 [Shinella sumterensis]
MISTIFIAEKFQIGAGLSGYIADIGPAYFTVDNTPTRLQSLKADPWADFTEAARPLKASKQKA